MGLVHDAVVLVASGHSTRVTVVGLALGESLLPSATALAAEQGVRIVPQWTTDETGLSLLVDRPEPTEREV